jgi:hypothetical protein
MSGSLPRGSRWNLLAAFCAAAGLALASTAWADDIDDYTASAAVKAQKALREVKGLIAAARKLEASNPTQARGLLKEARYQLDAATGIPARDRTALQQQIRTALASVEAAIRERNSEAEAAADRELQKKRAEAQRRELEAQKKQNGPYGKARDMTGTGKKALTAYDKLRKMREAGFRDFDAGTLKSASQVTEDRFPKGFKEITDRRKPKLTKAEDHLLTMLKSPMTVDFDKMSLKDVIGYLHDKTNINIFVDEESLKEANIEYDDPVSFKARNAEVKTILKTVLAKKGLTYIIKEAAVHVMTPEKAKQFVVTRAYPVADLMPTPNPNLPPAVYRMQMLQGARELIAMIVSTVDPPSWQENGGTGTITINPTDMTLVIRQTAEFHSKFGKILGK